MNYEDTQGLTNEGRLQDTGQRKFIEVVEDDNGVSWEIYSYEVVKNKGKDDELRDTIKVRVPATLEDARATGDATFLLDMKSKYVADLGTQHRRTMVTDSEKQAERQSDIDAIAKKIQKQTGLTMDDARVLAENMLENAE